MADQPLMCRARDCTNWYLVPVVAGQDPSQYCSEACNRREAKHRKRDRAAVPEVPQAPERSKPKPMPPKPKKFSKSYKIRFARRRPRVASRKRGYSTPGRCQVTRQVSGSLARPACQ